MTKEKRERPKWRDAGGHVWRVRDMSDSHLANATAYLYQRIAQHDGHDCLMCQVARLYGGILVYDPGECDVVEGWRLMIGHFQDEAIRRETAIGAWAEGVRR